ncbi:MAG TPA: DUF1439 domain-containing protein, partial [Xanthobacteraceae bacterium]|nr:DUF1439 domain-containing protein [Xanthobacteraceae bacterium]
TRRRLAWISLVVAGVLVAAGALWSVFGPDKITLTQSELQQRVNRALPRTFKGVTVEQANVTVADGRVALRVDTQAAVLGQSFRASVAARGVPRFSADDGALFFDADDVKVADFAVTGGKVAERLGPLRERAETAAGKAIELAIKTYLAERPVYRFKDDFKGIVLKAVVAGVATQDDAVIISVTLVKLTKMVAISIALLLGILYLIIQLVRHPGWGLAALGIATDVALS